MNERLTKPKSRRAVYRKLVDVIDNERFAFSAGHCAEIAAESGRDGAPPEQIAWTLEGLYDGLCLNLLMYPGRCTREQARMQVQAYLATVFPNHFDMPGFP